jgi:Calpain family cysteine protease
MTLEYKAARVPGPMGVIPGALGGRIPGPLGFQHVDLSKGTATKAVPKTFVMPEPASGGTFIIRVRSVSWKLSKDDKPAVEDVSQGQLSNCPVPAILAALANTAVGQTRLNGMVTEYNNVSVKTTVSGATIKALNDRAKDEPDHKSPPAEIQTRRYFTVDLHDTTPTPEVSDVLYVDDDDGPDPTPVYMHSKNSVLWPCIIEKACAVKMGNSYATLDDKTTTANDFWTLIVGKDPGGFSVTDTTDLAKIKEAADKAKRIPTMGASRLQTTAIGIPADHAYAILGMKGRNVALYNPWGLPKDISLEEFRANFQTILFGTP